MCGVCLNWTAREWGLLFSAREKSKAKSQGKPNKGKSLPSSVSPQDIGAGTSQGGVQAVAQTPGFVQAPSALDLVRAGRATTLSVSDSSPLREVSKSRAPSDASSDICVTSSQVSKQDESSMVRPPAPTATSATEGSLTPLGVLAQTEGSPTGLSLRSPRPALPSCEGSSGRSPGRDFSQSSQTGEFQPAAQRGVEIKATYQENRASRSGSPPAGDEPRRDSSSGAPAKAGGGKEKSRTSSPTSVGERWRDMRSSQFASVDRQIARSHSSISVDERGMGPDPRFCLDASADRQVRVSHSGSPTLVDESERDLRSCFPVSAGRQGRTRTRSPTSVGRRVRDPRSRSPALSGRRGRNPRSGYSVSADRRDREPRSRSPVSAGRRGRPRSRSPVSAGRRGGGPRSRSPASAGRRGRSRSRGGGRHSRTPVSAGRRERYRSRSPTPVGREGRGPRFRSSASAGRWERDSRSRTPASVGWRERTRSRSSDLSDRRRSEAGSGSPYFRDSRRASRPSRSVSADRRGRHAQSRSSVAAGRSREGGSGGHSSHKNHGRLDSHGSKRRTVRKRAASESSSGSSSEADSSSSFSSLPKRKKRRGGKDPSGSDLVGIVRQLLAAEVKPLLLQEIGKLMPANPLPPSATAPDPDPLDRIQPSAASAPVLPVATASAPVPMRQEGVEVIRPSEEQIAFPQTERDLDVLSLHPHQGENFGSVSEAESETRPPAAVEGKTSVTLSGPQISSSSVKVDSDGSDNEGDLDSPSYAEVISKLRLRLGSACPPIPSTESKSGTSAMDFFSGKKVTSSCPPLPQSSIVREIVEGTNKRMQGECVASGQNLPFFPKGLSTGKFPGLKPKVFKPDSYQAQSPFFGPNPAPLEPTFKQVAKGSSPASSITIPLNVIESWESLARSGVQVVSHMDMFLFGILSILNNPNPTDEGLAEARRYLEALAYANKHLVELLVRQAGGCILARRDAHLSSCVLDKDVKQGLRVQPLEGSSLFGPVLQETVKAYKEDITRRSLQKVVGESSSAPKKAKPSAGKKRPQHSAPQQRVVSLSAKSTPVVAVPSKPSFSKKNRRKQQRKQQK